MKVTIEVGASVSCYHSEDVQVPDDIVLKGEQAVREWLTDKAECLAGERSFDPSWESIENFRIVCTSNADSGYSMLDDLRGYPLSIDDCVMYGRTLADIYKSMSEIEDLLEGGSGAAITAILANVAKVKREIERDTHGRCKE